MQLHRGSIECQGQRVGLPVTTSQPRTFRRATPAHTQSQKKGCLTQWTPRTLTTARAEPSASPSGPAAAPAGTPVQFTPGSEEERQKATETLKSCRVMLAEIQGLDFPRREAELYVKAASKPPKEWTHLQGAELEEALNSARNVMELMLKVDEDGDKLGVQYFKDLRGLLLLQAMLFDLWRWRRLGGGEEEGQLPHQAALQDIQRYKKEDIERVTSSLLDSLPISDKDKFEMSGAVEGAAMNAVNGAVWGSMLAGLGFVVLFNFARGGG